MRMQFKPVEFGPVSPPICIKYVLVLTHLCLGLTSGLVTCGFVTKISLAFVISSICATYSAYIYKLQPKSEVDLHFI